MPEVSLPPEIPLHIQANWWADLRQLADSIVEHCESYCQPLTLTARDVIIALDIAQHAIRDKHLAKPFVDATEWLQESTE